MNSSNPYYSKLQSASNYVSINPYCVRSSGSGTNSAFYFVFYNSNSLSTYLTQSYISQTYYSMTSYSSYVYVNIPQNQIDYVKCSQCMTYSDYTYSFDITSQSPQSMSFTVDYSVNQQTSQRKKTISLSSYSSSSISLDYSSFSSYSTPYLAITCLSVSGCNIRYTMSRSSSSSSGSVSFIAFIAIPIIFFVIAVIASVLGVVLKRRRLLYRAAMLQSISNSSHTTPATTLVTTQTVPPNTTPYVPQPSYYPTQPTAPIGGYYDPNTTYPQSMIPPPTNPNVANYSQPYSNENNIYMPPQNQPYIHPSQSQPYYNPQM